MKRIFCSLAAVGAVLIFSGAAEAQYWWPTNPYRHGQLHDRLDHREYHRQLRHRQAHRYPMTWWQHERFHDRLDHSRYHDYLRHRRYHRDYNYSWSPYGGYQYYPRRGFSIQTPWFSFGYQDD